MVKKEVTDDMILIWGHIIVLSLIFIIGIGMVFNVIRFENSKIVVSFEKNNIYKNKDKINNFSKNNSEICEKNNDLYSQECQIYYLEEINIINPIECNYFSKENIEKCYDKSFFFIFDDSKSQYNCSSYENQFEKISCFENYMTEKLILNNDNTIKCEKFFSKEKYDDCKLILSEYINRENGEYNRFCEKLKDFEMQNLCIKKENEVIFY